ncbi:MAG: ABC transporter substrate-binding protein [Thermoanaerobaculia bacterium]
MQLRTCLTLLALLLCGACAAPERAATQNRTAAPAQRIVTLAPNLTEIVAAIGAVSRLVGTDDYSNVPESVNRLPKVGGVTPSLEAIVALRPDVVVAPASTAAPALERALDGLGTPMIRVRTERMSDVSVAMLDLGRVLGVEASAHAAARRLDDAIERARRERGPKRRLLIVVWPDPLYVAARETFADDLLQLCGAENAVPPGVRGWPQYSLEAVVAADPDALILFGREASGESPLDYVRRDPRWARLRAVRTGSVFVVDEDRFSRPGPRLPEAAGELNALLDGMEARR